MADVTKHLERARKYLEKNKLRDAAEEYQAALEGQPGLWEAVQALADIYTRLNDPERAAHYYGLHFDRLVEQNDATKAVALYTRFLKSVPQPAERIARYALLLQKQNKRDDAIENYNAAAEMFLSQGKEADALACWEKIAGLDFDNPARHIKIGEVGERLGKSDVAARGYLRAGQLALSGGELDRALDLLERANRLAPRERTVALFYAEARLRKGQAPRAVEVLTPFDSTEADPAFLEVFGEALMRAGQLEKAREVLLRFYRDRPNQYEKLFELADCCFQAGQDAQGVEILADLKERMLGAKQPNEFAAQMDRVGESNPKSIPLAEFCGRFYNELNRESKYFDVLVRLFDLYAAAENYRGAGEALDRLVDIDPYDFRHQERLHALEGKTDAAYLRGVSSRMVKAASVGGQGSIGARASGETAAAPTSDEGRARQTLDDLIVQTEIFLQYQMQDKAVERLKRLAELFPGEEERNERLRNLYGAANWWPEGARRTPAPAPASPPSTTISGLSKTGVYSAETIRDLSKITEITRNLFRQSTPKAVLSTTVNEVGGYLRVTRCIAVVGPQGQPPQMAAEYCAPETSPVEGAQLMKLLAQLGQMPPDALGGIPLVASVAPVLQGMGLEAALGVPLTDKESQAPAGMIILASAPPRKWKQNEYYFLQAVGDQVLICVNHTKLRSLVRTLQVADEKTGLLGRSSYLDCLLAEANRSKSQNTPLSLLILQIDRGPELVRQQGEALVERYVEQVARALQAGIRQNDLAVKYTGWALAFVLPDTPAEKAKLLAEKLRRAAAGVQAPWDQGKVTHSAAIAQASARPDYDSEDIVTDLINRAEFGLEEIRKKGGDTVLSL
jgi:diguanylate cyclase (GGDEF)-like protein